jgi:glucose 1-dehydrogenase
VCLSVCARVGYPVKSNILSRIQELKKELEGEKEVKGQLWPMRCDVSKEDEVKAMFQDILKDDKLGRVDVMINNAGT